MQPRISADERAQAWSWARALYVVTALCVCLDVLLVAQMPQGFRMTTGMLLDGAVGAGSSAIGFVLLRREATLRIGLLVIALANLVALRSLTLLAQLAPGYLSRSLNADDLLRRWDDALGFDWMWLLRLHVEYPLLAKLAHTAYRPLPEMGFAILFALALWGTDRMLCRFVVSIMVGLSTVFLIAMFMPAYGPYATLGITPAQHPGLDIQFSGFPLVFDALRAGVIDIYADQIPAGTIAFPSFHTTVIVLYVWAAWRTPFRWVAIAVQTLSAFAIPIQGTHYLSDMIMGATVGILAIAASRLIIRTAREPDLRSALMSAASIQRA